MRSNLLYTGSVLFTKIVSPCVCTVWALYDLLLCESLCWYGLRDERDSFRSGTRFQWICRQV